MLLVESLLEWRINNCQLEIFLYSRLASVHFSWWGQFVVVRTSDVSSVTSSPDTRQTLLLKGVKCKHKFVLPSKSWFYIFTWHYSVWYYIWYPIKMKDFGHFEFINVHENTWVEQKLEKIGFEDRRSNLLLHPFFSREKREEASSRARPDCPVWGIHTLWHPE